MLIFVTSKTFFSQKVESIEEAFSTFLVHKPSEKRTALLEELKNVFNGVHSEQEIGVKQFLVLASTMTNHSRLHCLFKLLENLVTSGVLPARLELYSFNRSK